MAGLRAPRLPGRHLALALVAGAGQAVQEEWRASPTWRWAAARPRPDGFGIQARDFRPVDPEAGRAIMAGAFVLAGQTLAVGIRGDPWDRPSPSRPFAEALHRFEWLPSLIATGPDGAAEALRLTLEWRRLFGRWNAFAWSPAVMARRVFNLACAGPALAARASDAETARIAADLARQARDLLAAGGAEDAVERCVCAAVAGAALRGPPGRKLLDKALARLPRALAATVGADGGHATRRPDLALELLFDLQTLDEAMVQRGMAAPEGVQRAIDRLAGAVRFFTLADGSLATFHGGGARTAPYVAAARAQDEAGDRPLPSQLGGYERLDAPGLQMVADVAAPPAGVWSRSASAHPLAVQVLAGGRRLIDAGAGRLIRDGATMDVGERGVGEVLAGHVAKSLGPRLVDSDIFVEAQRHEAAGALWLDLAHQGWMPRHGLVHQRRLYLDTEAGELRGEDRLTPTARAQGPDGRHFVPYALRFPLHPGVQAMVSQDKRSVLLRLPGPGAGWILRNDVLDFSLETLTPGPGLLLVLRGQRRADSGARVRWKLAPARQGVDGPKAQA
ncbi:heparinase II/III family protein [Phenylobacterium kunshanense]|uniref:Heparinase n=1 Tax=Phenylobacterium kunshanense TaxID=1445034 RepID=A0A328BIN1_9CAUL|nr:heparinase II/III family protein [Phenylobacterium kunshanense]RAK67342.1 heparinase [Phenylobacterium kunshanense]